jgi:hypothetical protein
MGVVGIKRASRWKIQNRLGHGQPDQTLFEEMDVSVCAEWGADRNMAKGGAAQIAAQSATFFIS